MNIRNKKLKAINYCLKDKYYQALGSKLSFTIEGKEAYVWTSEKAEKSLGREWTVGEKNLSNKKYKLPVKKVEYTGGENPFWIITMPDDSVRISDSVETTMHFYLKYGGGSNKKIQKFKVATQNDYLIPHLGGPWVNVNKEALAWAREDEAELKKEVEKSNDIDSRSIYLWRKAYADLIEKELSKIKPHKAKRVKSKVTSNKKESEGIKDTIYIDPKDLSENITPDEEEGPFYFDELPKSKK